MIDDPMYADSDGGNGDARKRLLDVADVLEEGLRNLETWAQDRIKRKETASPEGRPLFESVSVLIENPPRPRWFVQGRIETPSSGMVFGPSGAGKSLVIVDLAGAAATRGQWAGRDVLAPGPVFYLCGEGRIGLLRRFKAWEIRNETKIPDGRIFLSATRIPFDERGAEKVENAVLDRMNESGDPPSLIIVDTLARHIRDGGNENNPADMAEFINRLDRLRDRFGCVVLVVHHTGHAEQDRARGHSSNRAALDVEIRISKRGGSRIVEWTKMRDLPDESDPHEFTIESELIEADPNSGELVSAGVLVWQGRAARGVHTKCTRTETLAMETLREAIDGSGGLHATVEDWRPLFYGKHWGDNDNAKKSAFRRVRESLDGKGLVEIKDGRYFIPTPWGTGT